MAAVLKVREPGARYLDVLQRPIVRHFDALATAPGGVLRLRRLILSLAVRGKLVAQNPNDEPASALLKHAADAQTELASKGKSRGRKAHVPVAESAAPFSLPSNWEWAPLADIVRILNGRAYAKQELLESGPTPVLRVGNLFTSKHWYFSNLRLGAEKYCEDGDLLYAWSASFGPVIWNGPTAIYHYHIWKLDPIDPRQFNKAYLYNFLLEKTTEIKAAGHGVSMVHMTKEKMERLLVPYPPLSEQARIVARVDELMRLCDALEAKGRLEAEQHARLLSTLLGTLTDSRSPEELRQNWHRVADHFDLLLDRPAAIDTLEAVVVQLAVRGRLTPQDRSDSTAASLVRAIRIEKDELFHGGEIKREKPSSPVTDAEQRFPAPDGWTWVRLEEISTAIVDCPHSTPKFVESGLLCIDTNSFKGGALIPDKLRFVDEATFKARTERLSPKPGDLVFAREGSVGESLIIPSDTVACLGQRVMLFRLSHQVSNEFVRLAITSTEFLDLLLGLHKGIGAKHVNVGDMRRAAIALPPLAEQRRIVARVTHLRRLCADLRQRLAAQQTTQGRLAEALVESTIVA